MTSAAELARRLARDAEAVCRHYLSNGRRSGHYWIIGDVMNTPGRSLYVRLTGPDYGPGAAGKWTDAATAQHGDLLDLIRLNRDLRGLREAMDEASLFLALPRRERSRKASPAPEQLARGRPPSVPRRVPDPRYASRSLSARSRHHRSYRLGCAALSPAGLVPRDREDAP